MSHHQVEKAEEQKRIFQENPDDIETVFEALSISLNSNKELLFLDKMFHNLRQNPTEDLVKIAFSVLIELKILR